MTQLSVMDLAKQGDPHAIAALINRSLASKGIQAEAELEGTCLKISLQATQIPNQKAVVAIIHRGMIVLRVKQIRAVKILTYRSDNHYLAWQDEIDLANDDDDLKQSVATPPIVKDTNVEQGQNMNLVSNPKGVILVQKLSQIQQNLQEYQDIIVRFTDEQVGTVRCLTTLTELIQVISQPSFLFTAVASNPNLRGLLDAIAESSKTDQHGDQVITNLSILQPGQLWQKAKIRLVTKIYLEPAELTQDQQEPEVTHQGLTLDLAETKPEPITEEPDIALDNAIPEIEPDNSEDVISNLGSEANSQILTVNSLFDALPEPALPIAQSVQIVNDLTENSNFSDSLFDDFMNVDSANSYLENEDLSIHRINDGAKQTNADDDLFGNFSSNEDDVKSDRDDLEDGIEAIKSKIPKQDLDRFLQLMAEEDQIKSKSETINKQKDIGKNAPPIKTDLGATTIERILGNMETITLSGLNFKPSSDDDFVTLDDLSTDFNSVGF